MNVGMFERRARRVERRGGRGEEGERLTERDDVVPCGTKLRGAEVQRIEGREVDREDAVGDEANGGHPAIVSSGDSVSFCLH